MSEVAISIVLEASTYSGSVAVLGGVDVLEARDVEMRGRDEERLMPAVADCLAGLPEGIASIDRVVCGAGPGSFTSLRIAAAIAKGICHARGVPLYAVSSLALVVAGSASPREVGRFLVAQDAMRGESYVSVFDVLPGKATPAQAPVRIVPRTSLAEEARSVGAVLLQDTPRAASAARLLESILDAGPVDLTTWEPDYGRAAEAQVRWEAAHGRPLPR